MRAYFKRHVKNEMVIKNCLIVKTIALSAGKSIITNSTYL